MRLDKLRVRFAGDEMEVYEDTPGVIAFDTIPGGEGDVVRLDREGVVLLQRFLTSWLGVTR